MSSHAAVTTASPTVRVRFVAHGDSFKAAASEYERLWAAEGARIVQAMERVSGLRFVSSNYADTAIVAQVLERASNSGYRDTPMELRASYPFDTRRATLIHELGHRLQAGLFRREEEEHGPLFLWIYDVWVELYGREFADAQVTVERRRGGRYPAAWDAAMALNAAERSTRWKALLAERSPTRR
ncbi:MAG: hypothetical protein H7066_05325 [Cytophagaceae bacterium]|nr:hypothetical protein [Gemmatimonadaceae bacterium]